MSQRQHMEGAMHPEVREILTFAYKIFNLVLASMIQSIMLCAEAGYVLLKGIGLDRRWFVELMIVCSVADFMLETRPLVADIASYVAALFLALTALHLYLMSQVKR